MRVCQGMMSALVSIENAVDVTTINGLLKEVVREERYLQAALVGTVAKKEYICQRLAQHQVTLTRESVHIKLCDSPSLYNQHMQASISALSSLHEGSSVLHAEVSELNTSAREVSDQVCCAGLLLLNVILICCPSFFVFSSYLWLHTGPSFGYRSDPRGGSYREVVTEC